MPSWMSSLPSRLATESGIVTILQSPRDAKLLCLQRFARLFAYGASFLILVQFLSSLGISDERIGLFMTMTLLGDAAISLLLTLVTDRVGRRIVLAGGSALMAMSGITFSVSSNYWVLVVASVVGVISPSGNEIGPFRAVEESILAHLTEKDKRTDIFAWYTLFGTAGAALGTLISGWMVQALQNIQSLPETAAYRIIFGFYASIGILKLILTLMLSGAVEAEIKQTAYEEVGIELEDEGLLSDGSLDEDRESPSTRYPVQTKAPPRNTMLDRIQSIVPYISPLSRRILFHLLLLFGLDSFASGLASPSWMTYFFTSVHSLKPSTLGTLFLVTNVLAAVSNLVALPLAHRFGPLKTMAFTHLPSAIFLGLIPLPPATHVGTWIAMALLSLRACSQTMDQAPRQAFLAAAVLPNERTAVLGIVNIAKSLAQAGGIGSAGILVGSNLWTVVLGGAGILKASYDLLMLWMFLGFKDQENRTSIQDDGEMRAADSEEGERKVGERRQG